MQTLGRSSMEEQRAMNVARLAAAAAMITILSGGVALAKPAIVTAEVNLRKAAGTDAEIITLVPRGAMVEVGLCTNGWCQVTYNGQDGYSIATNLGLGGPRPPVRPPRPGVDPDAYPPPGAAYPPPAVVYAPPPAVVVGPPVYYYGGPYYRPWGWGYGGGYGWGWRRHW
jgi:hypothetical protein